MTVYFDNAATTRVRPEAAEAAAQAMREVYGNPSSAHAAGRAAAELLGSARRSVADALGATPEEVYFTSGGTESDNWAIFGAARTQKRGGRHIITSSIEHDAVRKPIEALRSQGWDVTVLDPDGYGRITAEAFAVALREDTALASVMLVNNETGAVSPVADFAAEIRRRGLNTLLHTDAVQGFCKLPFSAKTLGADLISVSAHKLGGAKGAGALFVRGGLKLPPLLLGGGQEDGRRAGTESTPALAAFGEAARLGHAEIAENSAKIANIYTFLTKAIKNSTLNSVIISPGDSPYILSLSLPGHRSEVLLNFLEAQGIYVSKSSACKKGARSHVLEAMRLKNDVLDGAVRVSLSRESTMEEAEYFAEKLSEASEKLFKRQGKS